MRGQVLVGRFIEALVSGERAAARGVIDECLNDGADAAVIVERLCWPAYELIQKMFRNDQMTKVAHQYATRLLRKVCEQLEAEMTKAGPNGQRVLLVGGSSEADEVAGLMAADLLEAEGYEVYFMGGGVAQDEILEQVGLQKPDRLVMFGSTPQDLPYIRLVIDHLHKVEACPEMQIAVGGGVFARAAGLCEEIGADLWAHSPAELVRLISDRADHRADLHKQRTCGRQHRLRNSSAA